MTKEKKNKVVGILGIEAIASNFNADFTGNPKKHMGEFVSSPFAIKYPLRRQWNSQGKKVLIFKSYNPNAKDDNSVPVRELSERYTYLFEEKIVKSTNKKTVIKNLLQCVDVINFGTAFTVKESNIKIDGVVQFNEGMNKYKDAETVRDVVLSPFKNSNKAEAENNTLGQRAVITEAHFFYNFTVNPLNLLDFKDIGATGYTEEAYNNFKSGCLSAVTNLNTVSKAGCLNEFAMFIELNDEAHNLLTNLNYRVKFYKENNKKVIDLSDIIKDIEDIEENIKEIEIFFNPNNTEVIFNSNILIKKTIGKNINRPSKLAPISIPENTAINNEDNSMKQEVIGE